MNQAMRRVGIEPTTYTNNRSSQERDSTLRPQSLEEGRGAKRARTLPRNATETQSALPFLPVKTCGCGRYALVGRQRTCDECKSDRNRERMQQRRGTLNPLPRLQLPAFSKYTEHQLFRCQALTTKGTQCKSPRPHGSPVCVVHQGDEK